MQMIYISCSLVSERTAVSVNTVDFQSFLFKYDQPGYTFLIEQHQYCCSFKQQSVAPESQTTANPAEDVSSPGSTVKLNCWVQWEYKEVDV